jgi:hypothetical protein
MSKAASSMLAQANARSEVFLKLINWIKCIIVKLLFLIF